MLGGGPVEEVVALELCMGPGDELHRVVVAREDDHALEGTVLPQEQPAPYIVGPVPGRERVGGEGALRRHLGSPGLERHVDRNAPRMQFPRNREGSRRAPEQKGGEMGWVSRAPVHGAPKTLTAEHDRFGEGSSETPLGTERRLT